MTRNLNEIQEQIERKRGFVALQNKTQPKDLAELLTRLVSKREPTVIRYKNGKECKNLQCGPNRRRSAEDTYLVAKPIFPDVTLEQIDKALYQLAHKNIFNRHYCGVVRRIVHTSFVGGVDAVDKIRQGLGDLNITNGSEKNTKSRK